MSQPVPQPPFLMTWGGELLAHPEGPSRPWHTSLDASSIIPLYQNYRPMDTAFH